MSFLEADRFIEEREAERQLERQKDLVVNTHLKELLQKGRTVIWKQCKQGKPNPHYEDAIYGLYEYQQRSKWTPEHIECKMVKSRSSGEYIGFQVNLSPKMKEHLFATPEKRATMKQEFQQSLERAFVRFQGMEKANTTFSSLEEVMSEVKRFMKEVTNEHVHIGIARDVHVGTPRNSQTTKRNPDLFYTVCCDQIPGPEIRFRVNFMKKHERSQVRLAIQSHYYPE